LPLHESVDSTRRVSSEKRQEAASSVIMTTYHPVSENLNATEPRNGGEAEGNCVTARWGGEQPEAKEQSQITVNSIRYLSVASLLESGEACAERDRCPWHPSVIVEHGAGRYGWSGNATKEVGVNGESCPARQWTQVRTGQQSEPPYELRSPVMRMEQREVGK
jgi:hypothetical protein